MRQSAREIAPRQIHELAGKEVRTLLPLHIDIKGAVTRGVEDVERIC